MFDSRIIVSLALVIISSCLVSSMPQRGGFQQQPGNQIPITRYSFEPNPDGSYTYNYETGNGIQVEEQGYLKNAGNPQTEAQVMQGSYSYTGPDGVLYTVKYIADENGFRAEGAHIPTAAPPKGGAAPGRGFF